MAQQAQLDEQKVEQAAGNEKQTYLQLTTQYGLKSNVTQMPQVGLGTWLSKPGEVTKAVSYALDVGYRHIDCAFAYSNEAEVGAAFSEKVLNPKTRVCKREDIFVTSKLWNSYHHPDDVVPVLRETLSNLKLDHLDLYLIHFPYNFKRGKVMFPKLDNGGIDYGEFIDFIDTWRAMEECVRLGLTRHIGLSNFNHEQIDRVLANCTIKPAVLQCESHPYFTQKKLVQHCKNKGIAFTAYAPLGSPTRPWAKANDPSLLNDPKLLEIANKKKCTVAQLLIKYQVERGCIVIPKSVTPSRIKSNFEVWNFELDDNDIKQIESFNRNWRCCLPEQKLDDGTIVARDRNHPQFPFNIEY